MSISSSPAAGHVVLITGATAGIGYATARQIAATGASVVITGRSRDRGMAAQSTLQEQTGSSKVRFVAADHATAAGNLALAEQVRQEVPALTVLVNNVGGLFPDRQVSADGVELTLALNLRAAALLTTSLSPALARAPRPRVINVASDAYTRFSADPFADVQSVLTYQPFLAYARAKLLLVLASLALADNLAASGIAVDAVNPGMAWTPNTQSLTRQAVPAWRYIWPAVRWVQRRRHPERAGATVTEVALHATSTGGYITSAGKPRRLGTRELNPAARQRALNLALQLTGSETS